MAETIDKTAQTGFGLHLTIDAADGNREKLADISLVTSALNEIPKLLSMHKIIEPVVLEYDGGEKPEDKGISGIVMIAESHISIHTFPQKKFFTADVYSCTFFDSDTPLQYLKKTFELSDLDVHIVKRGFKFPRT